MRSIGREITPSQADDLPVGSVVIDRTLDVIVKIDCECGDSEKPVWVMLDPYEETGNCDHIDWELHEYQPLFLMREDDGGSLGDSNQNVYTEILEEHDCNEYCDCDTSDCEEPHVLHHHVVLGEEPKDAEFYYDGVLICSRWEVPEKVWGFMTAL